jgi:hypothetical protein
MKHKIAGVVVELAFNDYADAATRNSMLQVRCCILWVRLT